MKRLLSLLMSLRGRPGPAQTLFVVFLLIQSTALEQTEDWNRAPSSPYNEVLDQWLGLNNEVLQEKHRGSEKKLQEKLNNEVLDQWLDRVKLY